MGEQAATYTVRRISRSAAATRALGRRLGGLLQPGDVVALTGELGAGKTELVRGVCAGARVPAAEVSSPTFAIVATYRGRIPVHHADLYRIADEDELYGTGFGDLVGGEGALLVEWADRVPGALPVERLSLVLAHDDVAPSVRRLDVSGVGPRHAALARALVAQRSVTRRKKAAGKPVRVAATNRGSTGKRLPGKRKPPALRRSPPRGKAKAVKARVRGR
jgi:tRNA threonylcarbamoyladenosine biosynthesis protein TsaE